MPLVEQEVLTFPVHLISPRVFISDVRLTLSLLVFFSFLVFLLFCCLSFCLCLLITPMVSSKFSEYMKILKTLSIKRQNNYLLIDLGCLLALSYRLNVKAYFTYLFD